jgi:hypothetical protein
MPHTHGSYLGYLFDMANKQKLSNDPITAKEFLEFVDADSDFGFEMKVLKLLRANGFDCSHSGTYVDPVTDKIRQFDICASMERPGSVLALAVECKNLRPSNPLLLSAIPRTDGEALHDVIVFAANDILPSVRTIKGNASRYKPGEMVGKKTDQVARMSAGGGLSSDDEATFGKLHQAVNSCQDLLRQPVSGRAERLSYRPLSSQRDSYGRWTMM